MLLSNFESHLDPYEFFPSHSVVGLNYTLSTSYDRVLKSITQQVSGQDCIVIAGTKLPYTFFGIDSYRNSDYIDYNEKMLINVAINQKIPLILINRGYILGAVVLGFELKECPDTDNHLNFYQENVYGVNSFHKYVYKYGDDYRGETYEIKNQEARPESYFSKSSRILSIAWNPEINCPQSGVDLFDLYLKKTLGISR